MHFRGNVSRTMATHIFAYAGNRMLCQKHKSNDIIIIYPFCVIQSRGTYDGTESSPPCTVPCQDPEALQVTKRHKPSIIRSRQVSRQLRDNCDTWASSPGLLIVREIRRHCQ
eukprot:scpid99258/ scgid12043/ 